MVSENSVVQIFPKASFVFTKVMMKEARKEGRFASSRVAIDDDELAEHGRRLFGFSLCLVDLSHTFQLALHGLGQPATSDKIFAKLGHAIKYAMSEWIQPCDVLTADMSSARTMLSMNCSLTNNLCAERRILDITSIMYFTKLVHDGTLFIHANQLPRHSRWNLKNRTTPWLKLFTRTIAALDMMHRHTRGKLAVALVTAKSRNFNCHEWFVTLLQSVLDLGVPHEATLDMKHSWCEKKNDDSSISNTQLHGFWRETVMLLFFQL